MSNTEAKIIQNLPQKTQKFCFLAQICMRIMAIAFTLAATVIVVTTEQSIQIFGITFDARYSYSSAFKYFVYVNAVASAFTAITLFSLCFLRRYFFNPANYFILFLHDLLSLLLVLSGCSAATAIGYVGQYGNSHSGWTPICDHFHYYCKRVTVSIALSYLGVAVFLILTIFSATKAKQVHVLQI